MTTTALLIICFVLVALSVFLMFRLSYAKGVTETRDKKKLELGNEIKKLKERLKKLDKKSQASGQGQARDDRKIHTLQESVNNLRTDLAEAKKAARSAEKRTEEVQQRVHAVRQEAENQTVQVETKPTVEASPEEKEPAERPEPTPARDQDEGILQQKLSSLAHSEDHFKKEVAKLTESLGKQKKRFHDGRQEWAKARRKYEDLRRAYIITKGQLDITQDMLAALETHTGVSASDGLLAQSGRAKKRHEIQKHRAEQKAQAEMPEATH